MNTNTITQTVALAFIAAGINLSEQFPAGVTILPDTAPVQAPELTAEVVTPSAPERTEKVLTKGVWKALSHTKAGVKRAKFAGMNREAALEAGLLPGYRLPEGHIRALLSPANA